jgi:hypothetical protein
MHASISVSINQLLLDPICSLISVAWSYALLIMLKSGREKEFKLFTLFFTVIRRFRLRSSIALCESTATEQRWHQTAAIEGVGRF